MNIRVPLFLSLCVIAMATVVTRADRPNVLFIAIDDLRCDLGCYGSKNIRTPHIDRFAATGVTFTRAYVQVAVCNPSRVSVMTGLRPDTTKVWDLITRFRQTTPNAVTLPQHFRKHGYYAVSFGKIFHNPWPDNDSWDEPHHWPAKSSLWSDDAKKAHAKFRKQMKADGKTAAQIRRVRPVATEIVELPDSKHIDGAIADQAIDAMQRLAAKKQPFFLAAGFVRPHLPFVAPRKYWEQYERDKIPLATNQYFPKNMPAVAFGDRSRGGFYELTDYMDYTGAPSPFKLSLTETQQRELKHGYYASISMIDAQVGRILAKLQELKLADNTIVVIWSDHGWKLGEHNGWCKQTNFEIDTRAPLVIRMPHAKANGKKTRSLTEFLDIYPTLCDLAELPIPKFLEGSSLKSVLADPNATVKAAAFSQFHRRHNNRQHMGYAVRTDRYRYVAWVEKETQKTIARELYDHQHDPDENENVVNQPVHAEAVKSLDARLWKQFDRSIYADFQRTATAQPTNRGPPARQPNILFLMADDWSWPHAGAYGDPAVNTPTFDRIAREGVLFNNAFVSSPSCTPSRMAIATGQYHWRLKEAANLGGSLAKGLPVYPELLQAAGYKIGFSRKGAAPSQHQYTKRDPFGPRFKSFDEFFKQRKAGEPFCFWYGAGEPHRPYRLGEGSKNSIDPATVKLPKCLPDNSITRNDFADYLHRVQKYDTFSGEIIAQLEKAGELENTIIVMAGDNGLPFPRCKSTLYDTGTHVPLAIRWGKNVKGNVQGKRAIDDFVSLTDLAPTFLDAAELKTPSVMTGRSLVPMLASNKHGQVDPKRDQVITGMERHVYANPCRAIRTKDFLYIHNFEPAKWPTGDDGKAQPIIDFTKGTWPTHAGAFSYNIDPGPTKQFLLVNRNEAATKPFFELACGRRPLIELYDRRVDPNEMRNVANDAKYTDVRKQLHAQLQAALAATADPRSQR